ncbi:helix-turn-helix transcriptional regulator [Streptomyces sp. S3(2020)]|uniref:helix-turn-helix domain-containing protein n=1 Tax=Streptomyces sp. S3(2020) TaxID=2732044 RepID=UPI001487861A|nr:helix-turn-helix domain-containing protein [Streptomyces sp. S3(2020)]NNN33417.1 helix-turn-helix transcriptional regulator [Streptomyces sp. S3(2020)]
MAKEANRTELGQFLKARRAELIPADLGLATNGEHRRVPGLRREEVAQLTSISVQYYTRLEQGRLQASAPVLVALADVLRLDDDQQTYLLELAGKEAHRRRRPQVQEVRPQTRRLLDAIGAPAIVLGRRMDILAWNPLAAALLTDFSQLPDKQRNYARLVFSDSEMRQRYANWEKVAPDCVAFLRMEAARHPDDPRLSELVGELAIKDPHFRQWWAAHNLAAQTTGVKTLRHPLVGELTLDWETLAVATDPDQQLVVWTAAPGTASHDGLAFLASWVTAHPSTTADNAPATGTPARTHADAQPAPPPPSTGPARS